MAEFAGCPDNILTNNATVEYEEPTATDGNVNLAVSCDPPSGSTLLENEVTTVICTASDEAGNVALNNCSFTVTVGELNDKVHVLTVVDTRVQVHIV